MLFSATSIGEFNVSIAYYCYTVKSKNDFLKQDGWGNLYAFEYII